MSKKASLAKVSECTPHRVLKKSRVLQNTPEEPADQEALEAPDPEKFEQKTPKKHLFGDAPRQNLSLMRDFAYRVSGKFFLSILVYFSVVFCF